MLLLALVGGHASWGQPTNLPSLARIKAAAENGDAKAQSDLADSYARTLNHIEAARWYRQAAEQGNTHAQLRLAKYLLRPQMPQKKDKAQAAKDAKEAVNWLTKAATQGDQLSQLELGQCYGAGVGVKLDKVEAYKWYRLAGSCARGNLNQLILKLSPEEIAEGQKRADNFVIGKAPSEEPRKQAILSELMLKGVAGSEQKRVALVNNHQFAVGDEATLELNGESVKVRCLEIHERSVVLSVNGMADRYELSLR